MFKVLFIYWILKISYDKNCGYYYVTSSHATGNAGLNNAARDDRARFWNEKEEKKKGGGKSVHHARKKLLRSNRVIFIHRRKEIFDR